jgi:predicted RNA-binding protein
MEILGYDYFDRRTYKRETAGYIFVISKDMLDITKFSSTGENPNHVEFDKLVQDKANRYLGRRADYDVIAAMVMDIGNDLKVVADKAGAPEIITIHTPKYISDRKLKYAELEDIVNEYLRGGSYER